MQRDLAVHIPRSYKFTNRQIAGGTWRFAASVKRCGYEATLHYAGQATGHGCF